MKERIDRVLWRVATTTAIHYTTIMKYSKELIKHQRQTALLKNYPIITQYIKNEGFTELKQFMI